MLVSKITLTDPYETSRDLQAENHTSSELKYVQVIFAACGHFYSKRLVAVEQGGGHAPPPPQYLKNFQELVRKSVLCPPYIESLMCHWSTPLSTSVTGVPL